MKKGIAIALVMVTMILCLAGCALTKATAVVTFENLEDCTLVSAPANLASLGKQLNVLTVNVTQDGVYPFLIRENGIDYSFILLCKNGVFSGEADEGLTFSIK